MNFGSINYVPPRDVAPPKRRELADEFDYEKLLSAVSTEWELAGVIGRRVGLRGQTIGRRLSKLFREGRVAREVVKTEIYWRSV